jgi:hypothetical protein
LHCAVPLLVIDNFSSPVNTRPHFINVNIGYISFFVVLEKTKYMSEYYVAIETKIKDGILSPEEIKKAK